MPLVQPKEHRWIRTPASHGRVHDSCWCDSHWTVRTLCPADGFHAHSPLAADPTTLISGAKQLDGASLLAASVRKAAEIAETPCEDMSCADVEAVARAMLEGVPGVGEQTSCIDTDRLCADGLAAAGRAFKFVCACGP